MLFLELPRVRFSDDRDLTKKQTIIKYEGFKRSSSPQSPHRSDCSTQPTPDRLVKYCQLVVNKCQLTFCATDPMTKSRYVVTKTCAPSDVAQLIFL